MKIFVSAVMLGSITVCVGIVHSADPPPRLPLLEPEAAWSRVVPTSEYPKLLPTWARILSGPMPKTTARMLNLDALHRSGDRLDARLRCLARWAAAEANGCRAMQAIVEADWHRAGPFFEDVGTLVSQSDRLPEIDRLVVQFARKMQREAHAITDDEVHRLIQLLGEERMVALVALLAHASFQDRVFLALRLPTEGAEPLPPITVPIPSRASRGSPPASPPPKPELPNLVAKDSSQWRELQDGLQTQRRRVTRIQVPTKEALAARMGPNHPGAWQLDIVWSRVCFGYQPELTQAWFEMVSTFREESQLKSLFANSIFWVVTQAVKCFY
ncbi:MAG: hypothetical protein N2039_01510 [Gemmataceae bacterium]|nr:hypothetical protein [Gemmataceae bacterium]